MPARNVSAALVLSVAVTLTASACQRQQPARTEAAQQAVATYTPGFQEATVIKGLERPTAVRFASDGRVFVAEKRGRIQVYDSVDDTTPTTFVELDTSVHDFWDRGLLGLALHPQFPAQPYVYVLYALDAPVGGTPPVWKDDCPEPPGANDDGCVVGARLSRLTANGNVAAGPETVLLEGWPQQYPSHSIGDLGFGADGALYVSSGDGAAFNFVDYGQRGTPPNPLGDPPVGVGGAQTPPTALGGALRAQSLQRPAGPAALHGAILRLDPMTGAAHAGNPLIANPDDNAKRIVAYGLRNPFRFTARPGTSELWVGEVGFNTWEEINRVVDPADGVIENFGWPCFEGRGRQGGYDGANLALCEGLYMDPARVTSPHFSYDHARKVVPGEACGTGSSSVTALAFYTGDKFPPRYKGALFFGDYSRQCAWVMLPGADGVPDPTKVESFGAGIAHPVDLQMGPDGNLYYVDELDGEIRRITYLLPKAVASATPTAGPPPLVVAFDGSASTKPLPDDQLSYAWDLDGDGQFDDASEPKPSTVYRTAGTVTVRLRVTDQRGVAVTSDPLGINVSATAMPTTPPVPVIDTPVPGPGWQVGDVITFSGHATDAEEGALPAAALSWLLVMQHCPAGCHQHVVQTFTGPSGSFTTPDHEYPSYVELVLVATDASGIRATTSVRLDPATVLLTLGAKPPGLTLAAGADSVVVPRGLELIRGGKISLGAPLTQTMGGVPYVFVGWSDGQPPSRDLGPLTAPVALSATYRAAGLTAQYFADPALTDPKVLRIEPGINFDWGRGSPDPAVPQSFSARWSGFIAAPTTEFYTFSTDSDDGMRVWLNGFLVLDAWDEHSIRRDNSFGFPLIAGRKARLRVEYYDREVDAVAKLYWSTASQPLALVPTERLYPGCVNGGCPAGLACIADECVADCAPACGAGQRCEAGACVDACKDVTCDGGKCVAGACVPRCEGVMCAAGTSCEPATGLCESACTKIMCPTGQACAQGACQPACVVTGCSLATTKCNATTGTCEPKCTGVSCAAGFACAPETGACQDPCMTLSCPGQACAAGECRPACVVDGCAETEACNATTGLCESKCAAITCASGAACVPTTGQCETVGVGQGDAGVADDGGPGSGPGGGPANGPGDGLDAARPGAGPGDAGAAAPDATTTAAKAGDGCGCALGARVEPRGAWWLVLGALVLVVRRRRRS